MRGGVKDKKMWRDGGEGGGKGGAKEEKSGDEGQGGGARRTGQGR